MSVLNKPVVTVSWRSNHKHEHTLTNTHTCTCAHYININNWHCIEDRVSLLLVCNVNNVNERESARVEKIELLVSCAAASLCICRIFLLLSTHFPLSLISYDLDSLLHILRYEITFNADAVPIASSSFISIYTHTHARTHTKKIHSQSHTRTFACSTFRVQFHDPLDIGHAYSNNTITYRYTYNNFNVAILCLYE